MTYDEAAKAASEEARLYGTSYVYQHEDGSFEHISLARMRIVKYVQPLNAEQPLKYCVKNCKPLVPPGFQIEFSRGDNALIIHGPDGSYLEVSETTKGPKARMLYLLCEHLTGRGR